VVKEKWKKKEIGPSQEHERYNTSTTLANMYMLLRQRQHNLELFELTVISQSCATEDRYKLRKTHKSRGKTSVSLGRVSYENPKRSDDGGSAVGNSALKHMQERLIVQTPVQLR
jgi:hypothetical protein